MRFFVHVGRGLLVLLATLTVTAHAAERLELRIGDHRLRVEIATTPSQRAQGLMGRPPLRADEGMLFVFPDDEQRCLWMRDTPSPLAAAFLTAQGEILNTAEMQPLSDARHCSRAPARYALETASGWFSARGVGQGARIQGLEAVAPAFR